jgi:hypothetical protein
MRARFSFRFLLFLLFSLLEDPELLREDEDDERRRFFFLFLRFFRPLARELLLELFRFLPFERELLDAIDAEASEFLDRLEGSTPMQRRSSPSLWNARLSNLFTETGSNQPSERLPMPDPATHPIFCKMLTPIP